MQQLKAVVLFASLILSSRCLLIQFWHQEGNAHRDLAFQTDEFLANNNNNKHMTVYGMTENTTNMMRASFSPGPFEPEFAKDLKTLKQQLRENYGSSSKCKRVPILPGMQTVCYGIGTTVNRMNRQILKKNTMRGEVLQDIDQFSCKWFREDTTKKCTTMFGDCYFPALHWNDTSSRRASTECHDINWFGHKYGDGGLTAGHLSWFMTDEGPAEPENCIALHIRRGDTCVNPSRVCLPFDQYYRPTEIFTHRYPELKRIVVLTDDGAFPKETFEKLVPHVEYNNGVDRTKYNVDHLANGSWLDWSPEYRKMENSASEVFQEVAAASKCKVLVGTLTAGISKWIYLNMMTRQGRIPMLYSLNGCMNNAFYWDQSAEGIQCEKLKLDVQ